MNGMSVVMSNRYFPISGIVILVWILSAPSVWAESLQGRWDRVNDCGFWIPPELVKTKKNDGHSSATWTGACVDDRIHGPGTLMKSDNFLLKGSFVKGKLQGDGVLESDFGEQSEPTHMRYDGQFKDSVPHGYGRIPFGDMGVYTGNFANGILHGEGRLELGNGTTIDGEFQDWTLSGHGTITYGEGWRYFGGFKKGKPHGQGVEELDNGDRYEGEFKDDKRHGHGVLDLAGNMSCEGEWAENKLIGTGEGWVEGLRRTCTMNGDGNIDFTD